MMAKLHIYPERQCRKLIHPHYQTEADLKRCVTIFVHVKEAE